MFSILAKLGLDASGFNSTLKKSGSDVSAFADGLKSRLAAAFGGAALLAFTKNVIQSADKIGDMADNFALTTDQVQELTASFSKFSMGFDDAAKAMEKFAEARRDAMGGDKAKMRVFEQLGISPEQLAGLNDRLELTKRIGALLGSFSGEDQGAILSGLGGQKQGPRLRGALQDLAGGGGLGGEQFMSASAIKDLSAATDSLGRASRHAKSNWAELFSIVTRPLDAAKVASNLMFGTDFDVSESAKTYQPKPGTKTFSPLPPVTDTTDTTERDKAHAKEMQSIEEKIFELSFKRLDADKQRELIAGNIVALKSQEFALGMLGQGDAQKAIQLLRMQEEAKLAALGGKKTTGFTPQVNALQRIGAQVSDGNTILNYVRDQLATQKQIVAATNKVVQNTNPSGDNF